MIYNKTLWQECVAVHWVNIHTCICILVQTMFWPSDETNQKTVEVFFIPADFKFLLDISWSMNIFIRCMHASKREEAVCVGAVGKKWDGFCPFWSGGQVWADNCRACAAETDDYRVYCLSQAQSTLPHVPDSAHSLPLDLWGSVALSPSLRLHHGHYIAWILSLICFLPSFHLMCVLYFFSFATYTFLYITVVHMYIQYISAGHRVVYIIIIILFQLKSWFEINIHFG